MINAISEGHNQYIRGNGCVELVEEIANVYGPTFDRKIDPMNEVIATDGANGALSAFMLAYVNEGDEVVVFEPCFPLYLDHIRVSGGVVKSVPLDYKNGTWEFDPEALRNAITDKTKMFLFNNPHNPTGKNFTKNELEVITKLLDDFPHVLVMSDEVYDFLTFDKKPHTLFASIGNNWEKTVSVFSGGKLFSCTGWRVGWVIGPAHLLRFGGILANTVFYANNAPAQMAVGKSLGRVKQPGYKDGMCYQDALVKEFQDVRDYMVNELRALDFPIEPLVSESGYFLMADVSKCKDIIPKKYLESHDYEEGDSLPVSKNIIHMEDGRIPLDLAFCRWLAVERNIIMMPGCLFQHKDSPHKMDKYVRMAICKGMDYSKGALEKLKMHPRH